MVLRTQTLKTPSREFQSLKTAAQVTFLDWEDPMKVLGVGWKQGKTALKGSAKIGLLAFKEIAGQGH